MLQTKGFPEPRSGRAEVLPAQPCAPSYTGLLMAAQMARKLPQHMANSELPLTMTTQGWCTQGMVLTGTVLTATVQGKLWLQAADMHQHNCSHKQHKPQPAARCWL